MDTVVMTVKDLCEYLKICRTTVYHLREKGGLPYFMAGNRVLFNKTLVDEWMKKGGTQCQ